MYWAYCPIGAQKGSKKGSKYGPKRGHFRAIFEPSWLSPYSPYWPVPLCTRPIYHRTQRDLSPVQSGTGQPGSGGPARLRTRYRAQDPVQGSGPGTGALLSHPGQYLYCTRPIYTYTGPVQGLYTRIQALYRYRAPSIGERLFPINQYWEPHPGVGKGYIAPAPGSGPYIQY